MNKSIYLVRHGETDYNKKGIVQGSGVDKELNDLGRRQAELFYEHYSKEQFELVCFTELIRTRQSIKAFLDDGLPHACFPEFNEINWGIKEGIKIGPEGDSYYRSVMQDWRSGKIDRRIEGGESPLDVQKRIKKGLEKLLARSESKILVCMHGRAMRVLLCTISEKPLTEMDYFRHNNLGLYRLTHNGSGWKIDQFNELGHLYGLK